MGALTAARITTFTHRYILPYVADNWYKGSPLLETLWKKKKVIAGGDRISVPVTFDNPANATEWDGGLLDVSVANELHTYEAYFGWKYYYDYLAFEVQEMVKANQPYSVINLIEFKRDQMAKSMRTKVVTDLYGTGTETGGTESWKITGLRAMCDDGDPGASHNYGALAVGTYASWAGLDVSKDNATYGGNGANWIPDVNYLRKIEKQLSYTSDDRPTNVYCNKDVHSEFASLFHDYVRWVNPPDDISVPGFDAFRLLGMTVQWDSGCPTGYAFVLNLKHIWLYVHEDFQMKMKALTDMESGKTIGKVQFMYLVGNLVTDSRNRQGMIHDIATT